MRNHQKRPQQEKEDEVEEEPEDEEEDEEDEDEKPKKTLISGTLLSSSRLRSHIKAYPKHPRTHFLE